MKVIIIVSENLHHKVLHEFESVDQCYSWLFNSLPNFWLHHPFMQITSKKKFRDLFALGNTVKLWQSTNLLPEYFTIVKLIR